MTPFASTYRVQLHADFDFEPARALVTYWRDLGIGACYSSPVFAARPGSRHGYDVVDPRRIDPQLGDREGFDRFAGALHDAGLGLLLDIVPNHQAATTLNETWRTMLAEGPESPAGRVFDVDWSPEGGTDTGRLVWPLLGGTVAEEIAAGHLRLEQAPDGEWTLHYFDESLPVTGPVESAADIEEVLGRQYYRLTQWRTGAHARNYRRFADVSDLAAVRVEDENVFEVTHALVFELVRAGAVSALRVDHVDGLTDPRQYLERLAARTNGTYTVIEKVLAADETLPEGWPTAGTTGYEVLNEITALFIDPAGRAALEDAFLSEDGGVRFPAIERRAKRDVLEQLFEPEWARVRRVLSQAAKAIGSDVGEDALADALAATTIALRVYRTYVVDGRARGEDRRRIEEAVAGATTEPGVDPSALGAIAQLLLGDEIPDEAQEPRAELLHSWQQLSAPVMAKGHEDTACYRSPVLLAQAEVGGDPGDSAVDALDRFQRGVIERYTRGERGLSATSTH
ncbi:MAG: (1-_4)-alpha-D-glucan 1-alpha-D-glucosylmutase, partial [Actinomycetota bacterium]|nr:(1->4)-alpha-D-glucan 1-alpha-D-glucosylmutase [Actinomycetota bacterium]